LSSRVSNDRLEQLPELPYLSSRVLTWLTIDLHVVNNPGLAPSIFEGVDSRTTEMEGNLDAPAP
jgi:hypothetical protein